MKLNAQELAQIVGGELAGCNAGMVLTGAAALSDAGPSDVSFVANPKYLDQAATTKAGLLLVPQQLTELPRPAIRVKNPQLAFAQVLAVIESERPSLPSGIHPSAVVSPRAIIGAGACIGPCTVIEDGARIGNNVRIVAQGYVGADARIGDGSLLYPQVTIRENVSVGRRAVIHSGAVVGADGFGFVPTGQGNVKIPQIGSVEIGDDVEIGANVTIDRATTGKTVIGSGTKIDNLVQIAHNVQVGKSCIICAQVGISGSTRIGDNVTFGGQAGSVGHIVVGSGAVIAARGAVTADIPEKEIVSGYPARPHREALKRDALINRLPRLYEDLKKLKQNLTNK